MVMKFKCINTTCADGGPAVADSKRPVKHATTRHKVVGMPLGAATSPCNAHLVRADNDTALHRDDLSFSLTLGRNLVRKRMFLNTVIQI